MLCTAGFCTVTVGSVSFGGPSVVKDIGSHLFSSAAQSKGQVNAVDSQY